MFRLLLICIGLSACLSHVMAETSGEFITVGATTSAYDSGLLPKLRQIYRKETGVDLKLVIKGTGRVLDIGRRGDLDALLVHDRESEEAFVAGGFGIARHEVMYNDFIIVGPLSDPANINDKPVEVALQSIQKHHALFTSRGDNSGTHKAELRLWTNAGLDAEQFNASWYKQLGRGMGATLNTASALNAYTLTDRGTWLAFKNKGKMAMLVSDSPSLRNVYTFIGVNPQLYPRVKADLVDEFKSWLMGPKGQRVINDFRISEQQLFFPLNMLKLP